MSCILFCVHICSRVVHSLELGVVSSMDLVGSVQGCDCIIVDDMIDTAGTLTKAADEIKAFGANRVFAFATHGELVCVVWLFVGWWLWSAVSGRELLSVVCCLLSVVCSCSCTRTRTRTRTCCSGCFSCGCGCGCGCGHTLR